MAPESWQSGGKWWQKGVEWWQNTLQSWRFLRSLPSFFNNLDKMPAEKTHFQERISRKAAYKRHIPTRRQVPGAEKPQRP